MWDIFVLFYLYGAASTSLVNITDLYGTWVPLTPLHWTFAQNCSNSTLMISTTFQLGSNATYVEKFLVGSGNSTDEEDFIKSVVLAVEALGNLTIDYDYVKENETVEPVPVPSKPVKIPSPNPTPNPSAVNAPEPDQIPAPRAMPVPEPVPEPGTKQVPVPAPSIKEPSPASEEPAPTSEEPAPTSEEPAPTSEEPAPTSEEPAPTTQEPSPSAQDPEPAPGMKRSTEQEDPLVMLNVTMNSTSPDADNYTLNVTLLPAPAMDNTTQPMPSTMNVTTNFTSRWVHVYFTPKTFNVTILSNLTDIYYIKDGPCMPIADYWKNVTLGCPCNGTWNNTGYYNSSTKSFEGGRQITPSECPDNTCHEALFLNDTISYANLRLNVTTFVENGTIVNKTVELTKMSPFKDVGYAYGHEDIIAVFLLSNENATIPVVPIVTKPEMNETISDSGSMPLPVTSIVTLMMLAFLLMM
jgi:hypothetical protein